MSLEKIKAKFEHYRENHSCGSSLMYVKDREIVGGQHFTSNGTFTAYHKAEKFLEEKGYRHGSMQRDCPMAIANAEQYGYIAKWRNIDSDDFDKVEGVIIPEPEFREGGATVVFFKEV